MKCDCDSCHRILDHKDMLKYEGYLICPQCQMSPTILEQLEKRRREDDMQSLKDVS